jgi:DNA polymerase-3 subunit gamma/tau
MPFNIDYRPRNFDDVVGNKLITSSLKSILKRDLHDIPHSIMFVGPSGCGKTTLARIVAKELGCNEEYDLVEIDAGSERGVETADRLKKSINYAPMEGKVRVFIIDEIQATFKKISRLTVKNSGGLSFSYFFYVMYY